MTDIKKVTLDENKEETRLGTQPISKLFWLYMGNGLLYTFIQVIQGQADGIFLGNGVGALGLAAVALTNPIIIFSAAASLLFVMGGSSLCSEALAQNKREDARQYYAISTVTCFLMFAILSVLMLIFIDPVLKLFGASGEVAPYAKQYLIGFLVLFSPQVVGLNALQFFNVAGKPSLASKWMVVVTLLGIAGEYLLIFVLKVGIIGSAIGYSLPYVFLCAILICFQKDESVVFKVKKGDLIPDWSKVGKVIVRGCPFFFVSLTAAITIMYINNIRMNMGMGVAIGAAYGITQGYFKSGVSILTQGVFKGFAPLFAYNHGAGNIERAKDIFKMYLIRTFLIMLAIVGLLCVCSKSLGSVFSGNDEEIAGLTKMVTIMYLGMFPVGALCQIVSSYYMCLGKTFRSFLVGSSRQFWMMIPIAVVFAKCFGEENFFLFGGVSDALGGIMAILFAAYELNNLRKMQDEPRLQEK